VKLRLIIGSVALLLCPSLAESQTSLPREQPGWSVRPRVEVFASAGVGHVFRFEDRGFGTRSNAGAGVEVTIWRGLRAGAEVNRTFGLSPRPVKCGGIYPAPGQPAYPCTGSAREGVGAATAASFTAAYFFGEHRVQPYVLGGISVLRVREFTATSILRGDHIELQENSSNGTGAGIALGTGLRISVTRRFTIRPEFRFSDGTAMSGINMSQTRLAVGLGYTW